MVKFTEESFIVEVKCGSDPISNWLSTYDDLIDCLQSEDDDMRANRYHYLELLRNLVPDWDDAKNMLVKNKK